MNEEVATERQLIESMITGLPARELTDYERSRLDEFERAITGAARAEWRSEYDEPEKVLEAIRAGLGEEEIREALKAFSESVRHAAGLDMQDFEFITSNTMRAFDMVTNGRASKPNTMAYVIEGLVQERIERALADDPEEARS